MEISEQSGNIVRRHKKEWRDWLVLRKQRERESKKLTKNEKHLEKQAIMFEEEEILLRHQRELGDVSGRLKNKNFFGNAEAAENLSCNECFEEMSETLVALETKSADACCRNLEALWVWCANNKLICEELSQRSLSSSYQSLPGDARLTRWAERPALHPEKTGDRVPFELKAGLLLGWVFALFKTKPLELFVQHFAATKGCLEKRVTKLQDAFE
jgi:hypothetical protein